MTLVFLGILVSLAAGAAALAVCHWPNWATRIGAAGTVVGGALVAVGSVPALLGAPAEALTFSWQMPLGVGVVGLDALSAAFLLVIGAVAAAAALFGVGYLDRHGSAIRTGTHWLFFNILFVSMAGVTLARDSLLLLVAWELMSISSFFLVLWDGKEATVRRAAWTYMVATHVGTAFLLVFFVTLGDHATSMAFSDLRAAAQLAPRGWLFVFALIGFGTKAGFMPLHVWLPEAHPAAPSHVSAVMSGVMIKTGIYGLLRMITLLGVPAPEWGFLLVLVGASSGILGVLYALAQHDLKRLLAYHSIENIGIIGLGMGLGLLGQAYHLPIVAVLGYAGAILHVANHALFKSLLFLASGAVVHATGSRDLDRMGGLLKRMPWTGSSFLVGATAISGLPPLNGFISEFLIFVAASSAVIGVSTRPAAASFVVVVSLAMIGGLASACFAKAVGIVFLGEPRTAAARQAHEVGWLMRLPMAALALACAAVALAAPWVIDVTSGPVAVLLGATLSNTQAELGPAMTVLFTVLAISAGLIGFALLLLLVKRLWLAGKPVSTQVTWDCGYNAGTSRMQYTSSSFAQPLTDLFQWFLRTHQIRPVFTGIFPQPQSASTHTPDAFADLIYKPFFSAVQTTLGRFRQLQQGRVQLYVLYVAVTLLVLLALNGR